MEKLQFWCWCGTTRVKLPLGVWEMTLQAFGGESYNYIIWNAFFLKKKYKFTMSSFCISAHGHRYIQPGAHWPRVARIVINGADNIYRLYSYIPASSGWSSLVRFCTQGEGIYHNDSLRKGGSWRIEFVSSLWMCQEALGLLPFVSGL